ncbi:MAG: hypothetical protein LBM70_06470 [Victivallales bacterium]|jgi:hypothetical protein|nr:hypothetical protein [Victivallales bacterium]
MKFFVALLLTFVASTLFAAEYTAGNYRLDIADTGAFRLYYNDNEVTKCQVFTAHDPTWKWLFGGGRFAPKQEIKQDKDKVVLAFTSDKPEVMSDYRMQLELTADGLKGSWSGKTLTAFHEFSVIMELPEGIYVDHRYKAVLGDGKIKDGTFSAEVPKDPVWSVFGHKIQTFEAETDFGNVKFTFSPARGSFSDTRAAKRNYFGLGIQFNKVQADTQWTQEIAIQVGPAQPIVAQPVTAPQTAGTEKKTAINKNKIANDWIEAILQWKTATIEDLRYVPDDARLIRTINPGDHQKIGLRWSGSSDQPFAFTAKVLNDNALERSGEANGFRISDCILLDPRSSILSFISTLTNISGEAKTNALQVSSSLIPGRIEREYNDQAFATFFLKDEHKTFRIIEQWGVIRLPDTEALALSNREMQSVFLLNFPDKKPDNVTLNVGKIDSHAGRDRGKRTTLEWNSENFQLAPGSSGAFKYDFILFKGLRGISAFRPGFAVNAQWMTKVIEPGSKAICELEFAAATPVKFPLTIDYHLRTKDGKNIYKDKQSFPIDLTAGKSSSGKLEFTVPAGSGDCILALSFSDDSGIFGKTQLELFTHGVTAEAMRKTIASYYDSIAKLPYLSAETPRTLTESVKADFHLKRAERFLKFDELDKAVGELKQATDRVKAMQLAATEEKSRPATPALRSMKEIKAQKRMYAVGHELYSPEGIRLFLQGMCDTDQFNSVNRIFHRIIDPQGELDTKKPGIENLKNPRFRRLAIDTMIKNIRQYGNAHSQYFDMKNIANPVYLDFMIEYFQELNRQGIWVSAYFSTYGWNFWSEPDTVKNHLDAIEKFFPNFSTFSNFTHTVVPSPEPLVQRPNTNPNHWQEFRQWYAQKYNDPNKLTELGYADDSKLNSDLTSESVYSPVGPDYSEFLGQILITGTGKLLDLLLKKMSADYPVYLGYSIWCSWPVNISALCNRYINDPRIGGFCVDNYLGGWWGAESNPPELSWTGDLQFTRTKPTIMGEWGSGVAMPQTSWRYGFESTRQSFGRNYFVRGVSGLYAWSAALTGWDNMFNADSTSLPVTAEFCQMRDAIVSSRVSTPSPVLSVASQMGTPKYIDISQIRLSSSLPELGVFADTADYRDLDTWDLSGYKVLIVHTEGVPANRIASLRKFPGKVILLGRPASEPGIADVDNWVKEKLFIKDPKARGTGGGAARSLALQFKRKVGDLSGTMTQRHNFAGNYSAWIRPNQLLDDVEVLAVAGSYAAIMRQGNLYWFTDMVGIENLDMPASRAVEFPALQETELTIVSNLLKEAGIMNQRETLLVKIVNDAAVSYDPRAGVVAFHNADAFKLPDGMFPRAYELFKDGVVLLVGGERLNEQNLIEIRCNTAKIRKVTLDGKPIKFDKINDHRISVNFVGKGYALCDLRVHY